MKKLILGIVFLIGAAASAQTNYEKVMLQKIESITTVKAIDGYIALANDFQRIGDKEKDKWQPYYYSAYLYVLKGRALMQSQDIAEREKIAQSAQEMIEKAESLSPKNAEIFILKKMNYGVKMLINPQERWQTDGAKAQEALVQAKKLEPNNPRIFLLEAQDAYFTPEQYGGSKQKAKELFLKSLENFEIFKLKTKLDPNWGKSEAEYFLSQMK